MSEDPGNNLFANPWLFCLELATHAREVGKQSIRGENIDVIQTGREVLMDASSFDAEERGWVEMHAQWNRLKVVMEAHIFSWDL